MSDAGSAPPIDPTSAQAASHAAEEEAKREAERQGASTAGDVIEVVADVVDLAGTVVEGVAAAIGSLFDI